MDRDGRDSDDADWLLAQLANGGPASEEPPVAPAPGPAEPSAVDPAAASPVPPRREESLDWFSLAESASEPDAATRSLPVIGAPGVNDDAVPPVAPPFPPAGSLPQQAPAPASPASPPPPSRQPSWNPPFSVGTPSAVPGPATPPVPPASPVPPSTPSPLTSVEPPVGPPPREKEVPPGPATPASPFALTWSDDRSLDSEDAIRAAFRNLSEPGEQSATPGAPASSVEPDRPAPSAPVAEPDPSAASPTDAPSPFAGYTAPPVARQTFTPVGGNPIVPRPQAEPPRHPIAPTTAPAGWDERRPAADPVEQVPAPTPAESAHEPQPASRSGGDVDHELWSALVEPEPQHPAPPAWAVSTPSAPAEPAPVPSSEPSNPPVRDRFSAFAASTTSTPSGESERPAAPEPHAENGGFPFLEVRGDAGSEAASVGATAAASSAGRRTPFPAFASSDDRERPEPQPSEHVDDLLAALGGRSAAPSTPQADVPASPTMPAGASNGGHTPPPSDADGLGALGIDFGDDAETGDPADEIDHENVGDPEHNPESSIAEEIAETGFFWNLTPDPSAPDPKADAGPVGLERPSPYAAAAWPPASADAASADAPDLGPDVDQPLSSAADTAGTTDADATDAGVTDADKTDADTGPAWRFGGVEEPAAPFAADGENASVPGDPSPSSLFPAAAGAEQEPPAAAPTGPMTDAIAALFGGAPATQAASAPAAASAAGSAGAAASPFAASAAATGAAFATTPATAPRSAPAPAAVPRAAGSGGSGGGARSTGGGDGNDRRTVRTLLWVAGGLVVLVVLAGLFYLGTRLAPAGGDAASGSPDATTASEAPVPEPTAAQPPGVHAWNTLFGGECLESFPSAWENEYTVVDCAAPHAAQLVHRGELAGDAAAPFPGEEALAAQMPDLCRADGIIDPALIAGINDLQVAASYPVESQWTDGERTFYCFANRSSGEPLTGSITGPGPAA